MEVPQGSSLVEPFNTCQMVFKQTMVDMNTERHMNEILAIRQYHMIYTIPYRHSVMGFIQV